MKKIFNFLTNTWIGIVIVCIFILITISCSSKKVSSDQLPEPDPLPMNSISATELDYFFGLQTVVHDGHWWIIMMKSSTGDIEHHPDCPKLKEK